MFFPSLTLLQAWFPLLQKGHDSEWLMIIFAEIIQLPRYRFIQGMKPSLRMYKALKIQQTTLLIIQCTMSIWYDMKQPCREDALLTGFRYLFTTRFENRPGCSTSSFLLSFFAWWSLKMTAVSLKCKFIKATWKQFKLYYNVLKIS